MKRKAELAEARRMKREAEGRLKPQKPLSLTEKYQQGLEQTVAESVALQEATDKAEKEAQKMFADNPHGLAQAQAAIRKWRDQELKEGEE
jgi:enoyl-CoA hydratase/carnithine racemase